LNKNDFENYYQILGLPDFASIEEVKKAFRELLKNIIWIEEVIQKNLKKF
jgi:hypothetical protein